jgi:hypothetical protein
VFEDPRRLDAGCVHLHLEHRLVQRLLGRCLAQGFVYDELCRACAVHTRDPIPRVLVLGRLSLYGDRAARLHDEILVAAAEWSDPDGRGRKLSPLPEDAREHALSLLDAALADSGPGDVPGPVRDRLARAAPHDVADLRSHLESRARRRIEVARRALDKRAEDEAVAMERLVREQKARIERTIADHDTARSPQTIARVEHEREHLRQQLQRLGQQVLGFDARSGEIEAKRRKLRARLAEIDVEAERRQLESDRRHWEKRLSQIDEEAVSEPKKIREAYEVRAARVEPVGVVYLWPVSG